MAIPFLIYAAVTAISGAASASARSKQGKATQREKEYSALVEKKNAASEAFLAYSDAARLRKRHKRERANITALQAASGLHLNSGSSEDILRDTAYEQESEVIDTQHRAKVAYEQGSQKASLLRSQGASARSAARDAVFAEGLNTAATIIGNYR